MNKVAFYHFLQPNIFTKNINSEYEKKLITYKYIIQPYEKDIFINAYPIMKICVSDLNKLSVKSIDLTNSFDNIKNKEFYLDNCHITENGNQIIANNIYRAIF